ncbi:MAG: bifunctional nuclease family protein [Planctomycetota bacterium]
MDIPVELSRILITELGDHQLIFLKETEGERAFPIEIGIAEALAIERRLKGHYPPRPMTHDLLAGVIEALDGELDKIVISDLRDRTFIATLHIKRDGKLIEVDSRPSDAIALGVAFDTPIFVAKHVFDEVLHAPATAAERIELLRERMQILSEKIEEISRRLADEDFLVKAPEALLSEHRRQLSEMQSEYDAIDRVLKKLG